MNDVLYPCFIRGRILKNSMLENLRDFPRDAVDCQSEDLSNGIISGLTPIVDKDTITFSKGIIKHKNEILLVRDLTAIQYGETDNEVAIKLSFTEKEKTSDFVIQRFDFHIDADTVSKENEIELCRFKLKKGAYLRSDYQGLYDLTTEFNTINVVHVSYAGYKQPTLSHLILKYFAKATLGFNTANPLDISFGLLCLNSTRIERETILHYLWNRLGLHEYPGGLTNLEIHGMLTNALDVIKKDAVPRKRIVNKQRMVMMD